MSCLLPWLPDARTCWPTFLHCLLDTYDVGWDGMVNGTFERFFELDKKGRVDKSTYIREGGPTRGLQDAPIQQETS